MRWSNILMPVFLAKALAVSAPLEGYEVVPLQWEVQAFPGGEYLPITGTIEEIRAKLKEINPNFDNDFPLLGIDDVSNGEAVSSSLQKRFGPVCGAGGHGWGLASIDVINDGIAYLRGLSGRPSLSPGPGECGRVSCSYDSAIWWCNDNRSTFTLNSWAPIADCATVLVRECGLGLNIKTRVVGQNFNGNNWNCIVREDTC